MLAIARSNRLRTAFVLSFFLAVVIGVIVLYSKAEAAPKCTCPLVYAPVLCDNGTYPNLCVAKCHKGTNCVPIPIIPPGE